MKDIKTKEQLRHLLKIKFEKKDFNFKIKLGGEERTISDLYTEIVWDKGIKTFLSEALFFKGVFGWLPKEEEIVLEALLKYSKKDKAIYSPDYMRKIQNYVEVMESRA